MGCNDIASTAQHGSQLLHLSCANHTFQQILFLIIRLTIYMHTYLNIHFTSLKCLSYLWCVSYIHWLQKCMKQSRLNNFLPLLCVSIPCKMRSYHSSAAQSCPLTPLYFKGMFTTLKVMERAIQKAKGIKNACYLWSDFVCICHFIPFNLSF